MGQHCYGCALLQRVQKAWHQSLGDTGGPVHAEACTSCTEASVGSMQSVHGKAHTPRSAHHAWHAVWKTYICHQQQTHQLQITSRELHEPIITFHTHCAWAHETGINLPSPNITTPNSSSLEYILTWAAQCIAAIVTAWSSLTEEVHPHHHHRHYVQP